MHVLAFANAGVPVQRGRGVLGNLVENGEKRLLLEQSAKTKDCAPRPQERTGLCLALACLIALTTLRFAHAHTRVQHARYSRAAAKGSCAQVWG